MEFINALTVLINLDWRIRFSEVEIHHLPFYKSDHRPLLINFYFQLLPNRHRRPFSFEAAWLTHNDFNRVVRDSWGQSLISLNNLWMFKLLSKCGIKKLLITSLRRRNNFVGNYKCWTENWLLVGVNISIIFKRRLGKIMKMCLSKRKSFGTNSLGPNGLSLEIETSVISMEWLGFRREEIKFLPFKIILVFGFMRLGI